MTTADIWAGVVGQAEAVRVLTAAAGNPGHAYLFVGPAGSTKGTAARAFAALLVDRTGDPSSRDTRLVMAGEHPDVTEVRRVGSAINVEQAGYIIHIASLTPTEGDRKVLILHEFHLLTADAAAKLLKVVEEPPSSTTFVVIADQVPPELTTIASRCMKVLFRALGAVEIEAALVADGADPVRAALAAASAGGSYQRATLLLGDEGVAARRDAFASVPHRLDGTGRTVVAVVEELLDLIDAAAAPLLERHQAELADLEARVAALGERGSGRKTMEERHRRELRRHRTDELRTGLGVIAGVYRDVLVSQTDARRPEAYVAAVERIHRSLSGLGRNANEALLLQALCLDLPSL